MIDPSSFTNAQIKALSMVHQDLGIYENDDLKRIGHTVFMKRANNELLSDWTSHEMEIDDAMTKWIINLRESEKVTEIKGVNRINSLHYILEFYPPVRVSPNAPPHPVLPSTTNNFSAKDYFFQKASSSSKFTSASVLELLPPACGIDIGKYISWVIIEPAVVKTLRAALQFADYLPHREFDVISSPVQVVTTTLPNNTNDKEKKFSINEDF